MWVMVVTLVLLDKGEIMSTKRSRVSKCAWCKKNFSNAMYDMTNYSYRVGIKMFCSYGCYNKYLKTLDKKFVD